MQPRSLHTAQIKLQDGCGIPKDVICSVISGGKRLDTKRLEHLSILHVQKGRADGSFELRLEVPLHDDRIVWNGSRKVKLNNLRGINASSSDEVVQNRLGQSPGWNLTRLHRRSEEHTSELQSQSNIVCRLLLEKK